jgi:hypothetical protein
MPRFLAVAAALVVAAAACTSSSGGSPTTTAGTGATSTTATPTTAPTTTEGAPPCPSPATPEPSATSPAVPGDPAATALNLSFFTFACAPAVVVVPATDLDQVAAAARLAAGLGGPLLFGSATGSPSLDAEIARLAPARLALVGGATASAPSYTDVVRISGTTDEITDSINALLGALATVPLPATPGVPTVAALAESIEGGLGLAPSPAPPAPTTTTTTTAPPGTGATTTAPPTTTAETTSPPTTAPPEPEPIEPVSFGIGTRGEAWLVDEDSPALAMVAVVAAHSSGGLVATVDGEDLRRSVGAAQAMRNSAVPVEHVHVLGETGRGTAWQVRVLQRGDELPGGGFLLFEGTRMVSLYGNVETAVLGVLGEQGPAAALERLLPLAAPYGADGRTVIPAFEIIATVAAAEPGLDGNYSNEGDPETLRPWIELAAREGVYVLLDLQPGRTDFLTQAMIYEEFLRLPHVGLALDPEWRLDPDEFHLQTFGGVSAEEVNTVVEWLAGIVREEALPQKMLLLHQFRLSMLPDRQLIDVPPELAVTVQMDGQGFVDDKYATWGVLTTQPDSDRYRWGWKNFFDEDSPAPLEAPAVLELDPTVVYVSFQ